MSACTFFGHSDCYRLDEDMLRRTIEDLIEQGVDTFYVGNHGNFDCAVFSCLLKLKDRYPHISFAVVFAYLPFCTRLCEVEPRPKVVQAIMGHAKIETTMDVYAEVEERAKKEAAVRVQGVIFIK